MTAHEVNMLFDAAFARDPAQPADLRRRVLVRFVGIAARHIKLGTFAMLAV
jgi:hypothetical protein